MEIFAKKYDKNSSRSPKLCIGFYFKQSSFPVHHSERLVYIFIYAYASNYGSKRQKSLKAKLMKFTNDNFIMSKSGTLEKLQFQFIVLLQLFVIDHVLTLGK